MDKEILANKLIREILARILAGEYAVGSRLPSERALSEEFRISRGTVRQALSSLTELNVVQIRHGSGAYVQNLSHCDRLTDYLPPEIGHAGLADILYARKAIETAAVVLACQRISHVTIEELSHLVERMTADAGDLPRFLKHDMAFHRTIVQASHNAPLITAFGAIHEYHQYFQVFTSRHVEDERATIAHHRQILLALERHNAKAAVKAIQDHLDAIGHEKMPTKKTRRGSRSGK